MELIRRPLGRSCGVSASILLFFSNSPNLTGPAGSGQVGLSTDLHHHRAIATGSENVEYGSTHLSDLRAFSRPRTGGLLPLSTWTEVHSAPIDLVSSRNTEGHRG